MRRGAPSRRALVAILALLPAAGHAGEVDPHVLATSLAELGPRHPGAAGLSPARDLLLDALAEAGLTGVAALSVPGHPELRNLTGLLPGAAEEAIVLAAHYDTVGGSPGALDDASGCAVVVAAAADLARTPRRRPVRVVLFDGEESGLRGSRGWPAGGATGEPVFAALVLEMVGDRAGRGAAILPLPVRRQGRRVSAPGWLVHAALRGGEAARWPLAVGDARLALPVQVLLRVARPGVATDSDAFLERGVPSLVLTDAAFLSPDPLRHTAGDAATRLDAERLRSWSAAVAAIARRLDGLEGAPRWDDEYLAVGGRVWPRRDLVWAGLLVWIPLVLRGRPGRWRDASAEERRRRGRWYLPGFAFRVLWLVALLTEPALALPLLAPAGLLALWPPDTRRRQALWIGLGLAPAAGLLAAAAWAAGRGVIAGWELSWPGAALLAGTLAAYVAAVTRGPRQWPP